MKNYHKKWVIYFYMLLTCAIALVCTINFLIDPYYIFQNKVLPVISDANTRYAKVKFINAHPRQFNSFILGSSRIGLTKPALLDHYVNGARFYNFWVNSADVKDIEKAVLFLIKTVPDIKHFYWQIDPTVIQSYGTNRSDALVKDHYLISGQSPISFYWSYLISPLYASWVDKIKNNFQQVDRRQYIETDGTWKYIARDKAMKQNHSQYIAQQASLHQKKITRIYQAPHVLDAIRGIKHIVHLCQKNNIQLTVLITPLNYNFMQKINIVGYTQFLQALADITPFWDFSGYNSITKDNRYYYEESHYTPAVSTLIAARIFKNDRAKAPEDFGIYLTDQNITGYIQRIKPGMLSIQKEALVRN